jgi:hypothetical protein
MLESIQGLQNEGQFGLVCVDLVLEISTSAACDKLRFHDDLRLRRDQGLSVSPSFFRFMFLLRNSLKSGYVCRFRPDIHQCIVGPPNLLAAMIR